MVPGIDPKVDYAFKHLFGRERNRPLLTDLLEAVLQPPPQGRIVELQLLNPFNDKEALDDKLSILDVKARDQSGRLFNVEMQMLAERFFTQRVLYYWARLHQQQLQEGDPYRALRPTVSVCFVNGRLFPQVPNHHLRFRLLSPEHQLVFTDDLDVHILELPKFTRGAQELSGPLDVWLYFLRHAETLDSDALVPALDVPVIRKALEELQMLTQNDLERERYEARLKAQRDEISRVNAARAEGELIGVIHLCQRRLQRPLSTVEDLQALRPEELEQLAAQLEQELFA